MPSFTFEITALNRLPRGALDPGGPLGPEPATLLCIKLTSRPFFSTVSTAQNRVQARQTSSESQERGVRVPDPQGTQRNRARFAAPVGVSGVTGGSPSRRTSPHVGRVLPISGQANTAGHLHQKWI